MSKTQMTKETAILCNAAEEWAQSLDITADALGGMGMEGRRAAVVYRQDAAEIRDAIKTFRPLRLRDENDEWLDYEATQAGAQLSEQDEILQ